MFHLKLTEGGKTYNNLIAYGLHRRERVKRRRAEAKAEAGEARREHRVENEKTQPDLVQLSKDLPYGWQVCRAAHLPLTFINMGIQMFIAMLLKKSYLSDQMHLILLFLSLFFFFPLKNLLKK